MADTGDIKAHQNTYHGFLNMLKWALIVIALVTALVISLISQ